MGRPSRIANREPIEESRHCGLHPIRRPATEEEQTRALEVEVLATHLRLGKIGGLRCRWAARLRHRAAPVGNPNPLFVPDNGPWLNLLYFQEMCKFLIVNQSILHEMSPH